MADNAPTIIGDSILVNGHLQGDEDLTVQGRVHGTINLTKTLVVEESGVVKADVSVRNAIVSGVVVGNITATESVELTEAGRMVGDISAPRVIIVDGARFRGNVDMGDLESPRASQPLPARTVERGALTKPGASRESAKPGAAVRRPSPPPPPTKTTVAAKPSAAPDKTTATRPRTGSVPTMPGGGASAPATAGAPVLGKKKLKKKVVVKKRS
jgi:cytoskeletal protein CcmA (bactofilin family)